MVSAPKNRPTTLNFRISQVGLDAIDKRAADEQRTRSQMVRLMIAYATAKMPKGWVG